MSSDQLPPESRYVRTTKNNRTIYSIPSTIHRQDMRNRYTNSQLYLRTPHRPHNTQKTSIGLKSVLRLPVSILHKVNGINAYADYTHMIYTLAYIEYSIRTNMRTFTQNALIMRMLVALKEDKYRQNKLTYSMNIGRHGKNFRKDDSCQPLYNKGQKGFLFVCLWKDYAE